MTDSDTIHVEALIENSAISTTDSNVHVKDNATALDPNLSDPTPATDLTSGNQPMANFLSKDAPAHSHPTPPPDQPLTAPEADMDAEMEDADDVQALQPPSLPEHVSAPVLVAPSEPSLVRPREEDDEDERAAKRSRVDVDDDSRKSPRFPESASAAHASEVVMGDVVAGVAIDPEGVSDEAAQPTGAATEAPTNPISEVVAPSATATFTADVKQEASQAPPQLSNVSPMPLTEQPAVNGLSEHPVSTIAKSSAENVPAGTDAVATPTKGQEYSSEPITNSQKAFILGTTIKNLKKTKHAQVFLVPVDFVALNIPQYPDIIKNPMDIGTLEDNLKTDKYSSVQAFVNDFALIVANCKTFNGPTHPISFAADSMDAYVRKSLEKLPSSSQAAFSKPPKRSSPAIKAPPPRRESRVVTAPVQTPGSAQSTSTPFALQADGMPQIRRDSSINSRPARAIKPPPTRELTYAKPKRKEHMLELKFCEFVLDQLRSPRNAAINSIFIAPVDPVALNIPHYRNIIKNPMDLSTMAQKLKQGQYSKANEFKKDLELMVENCLTFNTPPNPVRDLAIAMKREFGGLWQGKEKWEKANRPASQRATSQSGDEESADEDADEEEEGEEDDKAQILALQQQLAMLQNTLNGMATTGKPAKVKKAKAKSGGGSRKIGNVSAVPKSKVVTSKTKKASKPKIVTYDEKQEISEAVGNMNESQVARLTQIITENCAKYRDMEEMELEIDDLPNNVQAMLLKYVREIFGNPKRAARAVSPDDLAAEDDDDFAPSRKRDEAKRKKHKPMGKREQTDTIKNLQSKLAQFAGPTTSDSGSPTSFQNPQADTSGDEESEESEEE